MMKTTDGKDVRRGILAGAVIALVLLLLGACTSVPAPATPNVATQARETFQVGVLLVCHNPGVSSRVRGRAPAAYAVEFWNDRASFPNCPARADLVLYERDGGRVTLNDVGTVENSRREVTVRTDMVREGSVLCVEVHGAWHIRHAPHVGTKRVEGQEVQTSCAANIFPFVRARPAAGLSGNFRMAVVAQRATAATRQQGRRP